ncbi:MAG: hypothetical protein JJU36_09520 [Phycisphaeraceae bacterium]|nr:hypothetical protein [Phycisphaeraceae bacterium]
MMLRLWISGAMLLGLAVLLGMGPGFDPGPGAPEPGAEAKREALRLYEEEARRVGEHDHIMRMPGMIADRNTRRITLFGSALAPTPDTPIEFYVTPEKSGKDHEALATVYVKPSDVRRALEFIGMKPGRPIDWDALHFWPKGERVVMKFHWEEPPAEGRDGQARQRTVNAEALLFNKAERKVFEPVGLVFTGSRMVEDDEGNPVLLADIASSQSIASTYNDPATVLDVVRQAGQSEVYETIFPNPAYRFKRDQPVRVTIEPERREGPARVMGLTLMVQAHGDGPIRDLDQLRFSLVSKGDGQTILEPGALASLLQALVQVTERGHDPFVTVQLDKKMSILAVERLYRLLDRLQGPSGIRLERSPEGEPFFRAFLPVEEMKDRERAIFPGPELRISRRGDGFSAKFLDVQKDWTLTPPKLSVKEHEAADGNAAARLLGELNIPGRRHVLVFAPREMTYEQLLEWIGPMIKSHPVVFIFQTGGAEGR